jgi:hypothetical protein
LISWQKYSIMHPTIIIYERKKYADPSNRSAQHGVGKGIGQTKPGHVVFDLPTPSRGKKKGQVRGKETQR